MAMRKKTSLVAIIVQLGVLGLFVAGLHLFSQGKEEAIQPSVTVYQAPPKSSSKKVSKTEKELPDVQLTDWELLLVNPDHPIEELNPDVTELNGIYVDSRIVEATQQFLEAAQEIDPNVQLLIGYISLLYQDEIFNSYVAQEMAMDTTMTWEAASKKVAGYSQPGGSNEHQTGLAIDMSPVKSLNQVDPKLMAKIAKIAPDYGFIQRYPAGSSALTGVGDEIWHFRYVGEESAEYITKHHLTLEEYITELEEGE